MALYDGDMVQVQTPDGRTVTVPSGLAASFPGLQPVPPAASADPPLVPDMPAAPPSAASQAGPPSGPRGLAGGPVQGPQEGPVTDPSQLAPSTGAPARPQGPIASPDEDAGPPRAPVPTPPAPPQTNQQLAKNYAGRAVQETDRAMDEERAGVIASARVQADEATREGARLAQRDAETDRILQERAAQAKANEAELNARIQARDQLADQIAKTRIDRSVDHPIWAQIGLVLSMLGTAMTRRPGEAWNDPAYNTLQQLIERKVQGQMQDLDQKRQALAQMNVGVQEQRQHNLDRLTEIDARRDAALQQAQQAVQTIATQMKAPAALAGAQQLLGKLGEERAKLHADFGAKAQDQINTEAARAQSERHFQAQIGLEYKKMAIEQQDKMAALAERLIEKGDAKAAQRAKDLGERAVWDPRTGDVQLNPTGQAKMQQADQYEAAARQSQDPAQVAKLRQAAADLRDSARLNDGVLAPDKATAEKVRPQLQAAQSMTDSIGDLLTKLQAGPSAFNREEWAAITTEIGRVAGKYQQAMGERVSTKAFDQTLQHIINFDPESMWNREFNKGKAIASLQKLKGMVSEDADLALKGAGIKSDWRPKAKGEGATGLNLDEKTATEQGADRSLGYLNLARYTGGQEQAQSEAENAALAQPGSEAGLPPNATKHIRELAARAQTAGDAEHDRIVQALANPISAGLNEGGRDSVAWGMINVLGEHNPAILDDVIKALPRQDAELVQRIRAGRRPVPAAAPGAGFDLEALARQRAREEQAQQTARAVTFQQGGPLQNSPGAGTPQ